MAGWQERLSGIVNTARSALGISQSQILLHQYLKEWKAAGSIAFGIDVLEFSAGKAIVEKSLAEHAEVVLSALQMATEQDDWRDRHALEAIYSTLLRKDLPFNDDQIVALARFVSIFKNQHLGPSKDVLHALERWSSKNQLPPTAVEQLRIARNEYPETLSTADARKALQRLNTLIGGEWKIPIIPGEAWSDVARAQLENMLFERRNLWMSLFNHCETNSSSPSAKWLKEANKKIEVIGSEEFRRRMLEWLPLVDRPRQDADPASRIHPMAMIYANIDLLRGLVWCCSAYEDSEMARLLGVLAASGYKKIPGLGPRAIKLGNAAVYALGAMPGTEGLAQLALLKVKVKIGTAQKGIEKALTAVAERLELPRDEIEELAVPAYGMEGVGMRRESIGEFTAELRLEADSSTELRWLKADGKAQKSVPAAIKEGFAEELKELNGAAKDIQKMLPVQKERIDSLFLSQKSWPVAVWRERYLDHPLVGVIARRIIWQFTVGEDRKSGCWLDGYLVDVMDQPLVISEDSTVELWHPIGHSVEEIVAWRLWLERHEVRQPFKQAHREVYILTDAELRTETYSNRFAAHIVRQHQFNALCGQRSWKNQLRLLVDAEYAAPSRVLPQWGLRAEFWVEGAGTEYGTDTNETGTFLYLATDQVRFYPVES